MNVISVGSTYRIYNDHVITYDQLPAKTYIVRFSEMSGFFLEEFSDIEVGEERIYGIHQVKVNKVINAFARFERNLGVILSGDKGIGKSLFARLVSQSAVEKGHPVIIVDQYIPGIHNFIDEIEQEVVVLFDEFDKTFADRRDNNGQSSPQTTLLSLLDGVSGGKKLFIITCNSFQGLNDFMINRPGRFHYHFRFEYPSPEEIRIYLQDKLVEEYWGEIPKVINFASRINLNYDCLRAIAYELANGEKFQDAILDLNILNTSEQLYDLECVFTDGTIMKGRRCRMNLFSSTSETQGMWLEDETGGRTGVHVSFAPIKATYDTTRGCSVVSGKENMKLYYDEDYMDCGNKEETEKEVARIKALVPSYLTISRVQEHKYHYAV